MTEHARISRNGEVVIPKEVCEKLQWRPGMEIEIEPGGGSLVLKPKARARERITLEEFAKRVPPHDGPPATLEEMDEAIDRALAERWKAKEARSR